MKNVAGLTIPHRTDMKDTIPAENKKLLFIKLTDTTDTTNPTSIP